MREGDFDGFRTTEPVQSVVGGSDKIRRVAVYATLAVVAAAGLACELALGTSASWLLGDPIQQFTLIVGIYMSALGLGAMLSTLVRYPAEHACVDVTLAAALVGGGSSPLLFLTFGMDGPFRLTLYALAALTGTLVGMQLPLFMRVLKQREPFADVVGKAFAVDYAGALLGSVGFSLVLMPRLGLVRTTLVLGLLEALAAGYVTLSFRGCDGSMRVRAIVSGVVAAFLLLLLLLSARFEAGAEPTA